MAPTQSASSRSAAPTCSKCTCADIPSCGCGCTDVGARKHLPRSTCRGCSRPRIRNRRPERDCSPDEAVFEQHPQGDEAGGPRNLLALLVAAPLIRDRHFVHAEAALEDLRCHLRLDAEAVRLES